jgi:hypothetical protein
MYRPFSKSRCDGRLFFGREPNITVHLTTLPASRATEGKTILEPLVAAGGEPPRRRGPSRRPANHSIRNATILEKNEEMYANNKYVVQDRNFVVMFWMRLMKNTTLAVMILLDY